MILLCYFVRNVKVTRGSMDTTYPEKVTCREWFSNVSEVIDFVQEMSPHGNPAVMPKKNHKTKFNDFSRGQDCG